MNPHKSIALIAALTPLTTLAKTNPQSPHQDPILTRIDRSVSLIFLRPYSFGRTIPKGITQSTWSLSASNEMRQDQTANLFEDAETWRLAYITRWSTQDNLEFIAIIPFSTRGGGILDPLLDWWHKNIANFNVPLRENTPFAQSNLTYGNRNFKSDSGLNDITLAIGTDLPFATARFWLELPTGQSPSLLGSGNLDAAISLEKDFPITRQISLNAMGGVTYQGRPSHLDNARSLVLTANLQLAFSPNSTDTYRLLWTSEDSAVATRSPRLNLTNRTMGASFSHQRGRDTISIYFLEDDDWNYVDFNGGAQIGPDWSMGFTWTRKF